MKRRYTFTFLNIAILLCTSCFVFSQSVQVKIKNGSLSGQTQPSGIQSYKGIPFAKAPVGNLRWVEPQPVDNWSGVRQVHKFGPNPMQGKPFGDMRFRSSGMSEDCLYLNVWTPAKSSEERLPVLVYFYGGGYVAGDGSEGRYDGENMAKKGIVTLTVNYRLGVFGFFAHPELTKANKHGASGNYGLLDQHAALKWVQENISAFGGDPARVTIAGESAGSISVSAQMASPLSKDLIAGAIGESGAMIHPTLAPLSQQEAEQNGQSFAAKAKANTLAALREIPAEDLLRLSLEAGAFKTAANLDGYFLLQPPSAIFAAGDQAKVPLLAGWNSAEVPYQAFLFGEAPSPENYKMKLTQVYKDQAEQVHQLYPGHTMAEVVASATALASDKFINYSTWKWLDLHRKTSGRPVYRYLFSKEQPPFKPGFEKNQPVAPGHPAPLKGAPHAFEIEYAMGNLYSNPEYTWTKEDEKVSSLMLDYFANFIKTGNPNAKDLPTWDTVDKSGQMKLMNLGVPAKQEMESVQTHQRYLFLDKQYFK
ncbi:carboxylesterase/lipase family protein [Pedobacter sp.]|uniref:carboxylesterase/lipase family protein n=1 Tax=Pedobacter sp. TaxID=1411316 RepID=UPI003D7FD1CC